MRVCHRVTQDWQTVIAIGNIEVIRAQSHLRHNIDSNFSLQRYCLVTLLSLTMVVSTGGKHTTLILNSEVSRASTPNQILAK